MKKFIFAIMAAAMLTACGAQDDAIRVQVKKELAEHNAKCNANPRQEGCYQDPHAGGDGRGK